MVLKNRTTTPLLLSSVYKKAVPHFSFSFNSPNRKREREREMGDQTLFVKLSLMFSKVKAYLGIVSLQFGYAGMYIITMVSLKHGMNHYVLVVYRHAVATLVIAPFALVLERSFS